MAAEVVVTATSLPSLPSAFKCALANVSDMRFIVMPSSTGELEDGDVGDWDGWEDDDDNHMDSLCRDESHSSMGTTASGSEAIKSDTGEVWPDDGGRASGGVDEDPGGIKGPVVQLLRPENRPDLPRKALTRTGDKPEELPFPLLLSVLFLDKARLLQSLPEGS